MTEAEVKASLSEIGFTDAEIAELAPKFSGDKAEKFGKGFLRQSDYSKKSDALAKAQKDLADASERLNGEMAEWAQLTASEKEKATKQRADLEKAQQDVLRLTQTVTKVAEQAGVDPKTLLEGTTLPPKKEEPPPVDTSRFVDVDSARALGELALTWPVDYAEINAEHQALTGKPLNGKEVIAEIRKRAGTRGNTKSLDPRQVWEELHDVPALREAAQKKSFDDAIAAAEARGREAALTETSLPGQPPPGKHAPVFGAVQQGGSKLQRPQPGTGLQSAVAALRTGKYREGAGKKVS